MKNLLFILISVLIWPSCSKEEKPYMEEPQPNASFTSDADKYFGGETIHLKDNSSAAFFYTWTILPENKKYYTKDLDYVIDQYDTGGTKTITLTVAGKDGKLSTDTSIKVGVAQAYFSTDFYSCNQFGADNSPVKKEITYLGDQIFFNLTGYDGGLLHYSKLVVRFLGTKNNLTSGQYQAKDITMSLNSTDCYVYILNEDGENSSVVYAFSGLVQVAFDSHGFVTIQFSNLPAFGNTSSSTGNTFWTDLISGNITIY